MASDIDFVNFVLDQIVDAGEITAKKMFGEYALILIGKKNYRLNRKYKQPNGQIPETGVKGSCKV